MAIIGCGRGLRGEGRANCLTAHLI